MSDPLPKVSAAKYGAAKMRWREKGQTDGPIFAGTIEIQPCATCGKPKPGDVVAGTPPTIRECEA